MNYSAQPDLPAGATSPDGRGHSDTSRAQRMSRGMRGLAAIAFFALIATSAARFAGYTAPGIPDSPVVDTRALLFTDFPRGVIEVNDGYSGELLMRIEPGQQAFLRSVARGLARQRRAISDIRDLPFDLSRLADGRLIISDHISGETIQLNAFGDDNLVTFEYLLTHSRTTDGDQLATRIGDQ